MLISISITLALRGHALRGHDTNSPYRSLPLGALGRGTKFCASPSERIRLKTRTSCAIFLAPFSLAPPTCYRPDKPELCACYRPAIVQKFPAPRNKIPCHLTGSGGRSTGSCNLRGRPAPRRRPGGALSAPRLLRPQAAHENCWRKSYFVLCLFSRPVPIGERHERQTSSRSIALGIGPRRVLGLAPPRPLDKLGAGSSRGPAS